MLRKIFLFVVLISFKLSFAQTGWFWQNPKPQGEDITYVKFINTTTAIATTRGCTIMKSTDKGATWNVKNIVPIDTRYYSSLGSINILNPNTIFILQGSRDAVSNQTINKIVKSTDAGETWTTADMPQFNYENMFDLKFINYNTGFAYGTSTDYPQIYKTINSGGSWSRFSINGNDSLTKFFFLNESTGWIGSAKNKDFYKTTNAGLNWSTNALNVPNMSSIEHWRSSFFLSENTGWFSTNVNTAYKTTNGGVNWIQKPFSFTDNLLFINEFTGFVYGSDISKTTNGGDNWTSSGFQDYTAFALSPNNTDGVIAGKYGKLQRTSNTGSTWINIFMSVTDLFVYPENNEDIFFADANTGWLITWSQGMFKSTNGGTNWLRLLPNISAKKVKFINTSTGIAGGGSGVSRTTNGGANWITVYNGNTIGDIPYFKNDTAYALGDLQTLSPKLIRSTNGGVNWSTIYTNGNAGWKLSFLNSQVVFSTLGSGLFKSTNGGFNWITLNIFPNSGVFNVHFNNQNTGFVNLDSGIYKTTDGGVTFARKAHLNEYFHINAFHFVNSRTGWAAGGGNGKGILLKTTDEGETWLQDNTTDCSTINSMCFINDNTGWICADDAGVIKTITGGSIGIQQISTVIPDKFYLSQNYPNPFNPNTNIEFSLPQKSFVRLKVFDLLGREAANLVNENLSAGKYKYDFNASALPSGIYFYKLETENFSETRKMVLVK